ncbi:Homocysteine s-methyltransferase, partial [Thalictrum thalictroides]
RFFSFIVLGTESLETLNGLKLYKTETKSVLSNASKGTEDVISKHLFGYSSCLFTVQITTCHHNSMSFAFAELLVEDGINIPAWFTFNSKDGVNVVSGDSVVECASIDESCEKAVAVGINCNPPRFIGGLILSIQKSCVMEVAVHSREFLLLLSLL